MGGVGGGPGTVSNAEVTFSPLGCSNGKAQLGPELWEFCTDAYSRYGPDVRDASRIGD